jgi:hypothetical protein
MVRHPVIGLPLWVPLGVGFDQIPTRSGIDFENANKIASISFNFYPGGNLGSTYSRLVNIAGLRPSYNKIKDNFFALLEGGSFNAYSRYQAIPSGIIGFTLSWPNDDEYNTVLHGEPLATLMSDLFRANIEFGLHRSPPMPRPDMLLDLALAFGDLFEALTRPSARSSRDGDDGGSRARPGGIGGAADLFASFQALNQ